MTEIIVNDTVDIEQVEDWCYSIFQNGWYNTYLPNLKEDELLWFHTKRLFVFLHAEDALLFQIRWGGDIQGKNDTTN